MTHKDKGRYAKKHSPDLKVNKEIAEAVKQRTLEYSIPCAAAFKIVEDHKTSPAEVGFTIDSLEINIIKCQLGLFGYGSGKRFIEPAETVSKELEDAIGESVIGKRIACEIAWQIAAKLGIGRMEVTSACEAMKIKISSCQLGAF